MPYPITRFGELDIPVREGRITVATDAAVDTDRGVFGTAFLGTNGMYGFTRRNIDPRDGTSVNAVCELRAIAYAIERLPWESELEILTDSKSALCYVKGWQAGMPGMLFPRGYQTTSRGAGCPRLITLRSAIQAAPERFTFTWVHGHDGHPLNEFADSAAKLAMRMGTHGGRKSEDKKLPVKWAATRLADWEQLNAGRAERRDGLVRRTP